MKKIILSLVAVLFLGLSVSAATYVPANRVSAVGAYILSKNGISTGLTFKVTDSSVSNADISTTKVVYIPSDSIKYAGNDSELAAIISQELGLIVNSSESKKSVFNSLSNSILANIKSSKLQTIATTTQQYSLNNVSEKDKMSADLAAATLMSNAGYNPLAMIVVLSKMPTTTTDIIQGSPANFKRSLNVYDYVTYNYPKTVKKGYSCNEYKNFVTYSKTTVNSRSKSDVKSLKKQSAISKSTVDKQILRFKVTGGASSWDLTKNYLQTKSTTKTKTTTTK